MYHERSDTLIAEHYLAVPPEAEDELSPDRAIRWRPDAGESLYGIVTHHL